MGPGAAQPAVLAIPRVPPSSRLLRGPRQHSSSDTSTTVSQKIRLPKTGRWAGRPLGVRGAAGAGDWEKAFLVGRRQSRGLAWAWPPAQRQRAGGDRAGLLPAGCVAAEGLGAEASGVDGTATSWAARHACDTEPGFLGWLLGVLIWKMEDSGLAEMFSQGSVSTVSGFHHDGASREGTMWQSQPGPGRGEEKG